jgi:hypothetical protein
MRIRTKSLSIAILTVLLSLSVACSKSKPSDDTTSKPSDDTITKDVQAKVAADPDTKDTNVTVVAKGAIAGDAFSLVCERNEQPLGGKPSAG